MTNELVKTETNLPMAVEQSAAPNQTILSTDIVIPQLLLMQGLSEFIAEKKKCPISGQKIETGQFVRSTTMEILGGEEKPISFIPLKMVANWKVEEKIGDKFEYRQTISRTPANENLDWSFKQNGADWRRVKVLDVFALLPQDILAHQEEIKKLMTGEMPDLSKTLMPVLIRFKSTSFKAGMAVNTFYAQIQDLMKYNSAIKAHYFSLALEAKPEKNDAGNFYIFKVGAAKQIPAEMKEDADRWYSNMWSRSDIKVDESADSNERTSGMTQF
jgi:hypothetical protein